MEELARIVPFVDGVRDVEALVALEADQARLESPREGLAGLGLPDASFALEEDRLLEREREEERGGEPAVRQVVGVAERRREVVDGVEAHALRHLTVHPTGVVSDTGGVFPASAASIASRR